MFGSWVEQTTTTTGTGNLTLSSVSGMKTAHEEFGTIQSFTYVIYDSNNKPIEGGVGRMSDSTTMIRERVLEKNDSGFSKPRSDSAQVSLAAGTKTVRCVALSGSLAQNPERSFVALNATANNRLVGGANCTYGSSTVSITQNRQYAYPFLLEYDGTFDGFAIRPSSVSGNADVGLWTVGADGLPGALVVGVSSQAFVSGLNIFSFTSQFIRAGYYYIGLNSSAAGNMYLAAVRDPLGKSDPAVSLATMFRSVTQGTITDPYGSSPTIGNLASAPAIVLRHT